MSAPLSVTDQLLNKMRLISQQVRQGADKIQIGAGVNKALADYIEEQKKLGIWVSAAEDPTKPTMFLGLKVETSPFLKPNQYVFMHGTEVLLIGEMT